MKTLLIIIFLLLSIIHIQDLRLLGDSSEEEVCCEWLIDKKYYCSYFDGTIIKETFSNAEECESKSTIKCSNLYYNTKEECEKSSEWVDGKCYDNDPENNNTFLETYKSETDCLKEKADWTMQYCAFRSFEGKIYNQIDKDGSYNQSQFEYICKNILFGAYSKQGNEYPCFFTASQKLNKYFCKIFYDNTGEDEDCPLTMNSEICVKLEGSEYGHCSYNTIFGEYKSDCLNTNKHYWKTDEGGFCYDHLDITDKTSCEATKRGKWGTVYGIVTEFTGECKSCGSQYLSFKIILLILSFIFII